eukprot:CAMPEP_0185570992 /NCGR_PEP_ID=MMETSP0434-20130131/3085_1 /TAXON_ID=626734 ORGANISM="Favella taraikaensis, Strain Fe Narragansett Bay" /NCGR_SAMPLE_ID=MMETSP0434 /ASSEMBLY_ACC=CAM_ASM_000379 /LENGTH=170 /DNA_ID=CAMNT_0028186227 /DNA_START=2482 /DNA_END=2994 /DNA_ORIENTATION=+
MASQPPYMSLILDQLWVVAESGAARHCLLRGTAANAENLIASLRLLPCSEEYLPGDDLCEDAGHRPDVHSEIVIAESQQELRRPVPQRHHFRRVHLVLVPWVEDASQTEIGNLDLACAVEQDVGTFDVSMSDIFLLMQVDETLQELLHDALQLRHRELHFFVSHASQVIV